MTGIVAGMGTRAKLRGIKDNDGSPIFVSNMQGTTPYALDGSPIYFPTNGSFDTSVAQMVAGDWSQAVYSIRQDITVKILDQATIIDPTTREIVYSLAQQDMIAVRVVFR
ncbi:MAG: phage major capsid protein, partial [Ruthenibacterium sp.]